MISVIIATYNRSEQLRQTVTLLLSQEYSFFEIIVVDQSNGQVNSNFDFFENHKNRVRYFKIDKANLPAARNFGVKASEGDVLIFLDDDVVINKQLVGSVASIFDSNPEVSGLTGLAWSSSDSEETKWISIPRRFKRSKDFKTRLPELVPVEALPGFFMCYRKKDVIMVGGFDEWIGEQAMARNEDAELCLRLRSRELNLVLATKIEVKHLAAASGGCEVRAHTLNDQTFVGYQQFRMGIYSIFKNHSSFRGLRFYKMLLIYISMYFQYYKTRPLRWPEFFKNMFGVLSQPVAKENVTRRYL